jgi:hypothetical protein
MPKYFLEKFSPVYTEGQYFSIGLVTASAEQRRAIHKLGRCPCRER